MSTKKTDPIDVLKNLKIANMQYLHEQHAWDNNQNIVGVDEVGRGCLAGPVVVAAAILRPNSYHELLQDSKLLSKKELITAFNWLQKQAVYQIAVESNTIIDQINIYQATKRAMQHALIHLLNQQRQMPSKIIVDAMPLTLNQTAFSSIPIESFVKGESVSASVAAASIIAKVTRDQLLEKLHQVFPCYSFDKHKSYGTKLHQDAILKYKPSVIHRTSFLTKIIKNHDEK